MGPNAAPTQEMKGWLDAPAQKCRTRLKASLLMAVISLIGLVVCVVLSTRVALIGINGLLLVLSVMSWAFERWKLGGLDVPAPIAAAAWLAHASSQLEREREHLEYDQYLAMASSLFVLIAGVILLGEPYMAGEISLSGFLRKMVTPILIVGLGVRQSWFSEPVRFAAREVELQAFREQLAAPAPHTPGLVSW